MMVVVMMILLIKMMVQIMSQSGDLRSPEKHPEKLTISGPTVRVSVHLCVCVRCV